MTHAEKPEGNQKSIPRLFMPNNQEYEEKQIPFDLKKMESYLPAPYLVA